MSKGFRFVFAAAIIIAAIIGMMTAGPPAYVNNAIAQDAVWRPNDTKGVKGANFYTFVGADTAEYALINSAKIWLVHYRVGFDSTAADTMYFKVHDKNNDVWLVFRGEQAPYGGQFKEWYFAPEIDSLSYSSPNAAAWVQLQCFYGY